MLFINDFFVRYKEAVSNQMEMLSKATNGTIITATRFMNQKALKKCDKKDNIYIFPPILYVIATVILVLNKKHKEIHIFEEEPSKWREYLFNYSKKTLYVSMYRRPTKEYAEHLKKYKYLKAVFVELEKHKDLLVSYGIQPKVIEVVATPAKLKRCHNTKKFDNKNVNILFASWNASEGDYLYDRGIIYLLDLVQLNPTFNLKIPLRDHNISEFNRRVVERNIESRVELLEIHNTSELEELFDVSDFVAFVPQKKVVKDVPNSIIDGLSRGKPVIVSDVIDFSSQVSENSIGIVIHKNDNATKMEIDELEYRRLSENAYKYSERHTSIAYTNKILEKMKEGK